MVPGSRTTRIATNVNSANATFSAPQVTGSTTLRFKLTVSDGSLSADAFVNVTVTPAVTISPTTMLFAQFANGSGITSDVVLTILRQVLPREQSNFSIEVGRNGRFLSSPNGNRTRVLALRGP